MTTKNSLHMPAVSYRDYKLYAINFHTNSLYSIRDEFKKRVQSGMRRRVMIIDLEEEAKMLALKVRNTKRFDDFTVATEAIERCRREYMQASKKIADEQKFSLIDFWMENLNVPTGATLSKNGIAASKKGQAKSPNVPEKPNRPQNRAKGSNTALENKSVISLPVCPQLAPKQHNTIGRPPLLSKKLYIQDEPENSKLYIVLVGDMDNDFYVKLLSNNQPLQAIVHFLPEECGYDVLLPHPETKELLAKTLEEIQLDIFEMRAFAITKPSGYMQHYLPVISRCLAEKYTQQIYDQLSHYLYDIELLQQQYLRYYIEPFQITNVAMPQDVNVEGLKEIAESLAMQGTYLTAPLPAMASDGATITIYLEGLLNQIAQRARKLTPQQAQLTTLPYKSTSQIDLDGELRDIYNTAFDSILKVKHFERLCIAANNRLLHELLLYTNTDSFETIHYTSLEYNAMRTYMDATCRKNFRKVQAFDELADRDFYLLPYYAKLYFGENVVNDHILNWLSEYSSYVVDEIMPGCKLYHFKCVYNEVSEEQQVVLLPSPLCFRDFTLFQMEEFLDALVTPEMIKARHKEIYAPTQSFVERSKVEKTVKGLDMSIFIRPTSLKRQKVEAYMGNQMRQVAGPTPIPELNPREKTTLNGSVNEIEKPGLPRDHPLLKGYNLEDIRQEIQIKNSRYYFEEGGLELYEERWCFTDMNKNLIFKVNGNVFNIFRPRFWNTCISPCLRFTNKNNVAVRVLNKEAECAKVVINYPNGLAIYHNETYVEQEWHTQETVNREKRRMYIPEGAVIVHYQNEDLIMVLRYNGEVYRLYQYELAEGEEEAIDEMTEEQDSSTKIELRDSTANKETTRRIQQDSKREKEAGYEEAKGTVQETDKAKSKNGKAALKESVLARGSAVSAKKNKTSMVPELEEPVMRKSAKKLLIESIDNELRFLSELLNKYGLKYLHLIVTTSMGFIVNLTRRGKVYRGHSQPTLEWHDYFANESYAQRADGVRMIWTVDSLKCYHEDGTLLITTLAEKIELFSFDADTALTLSSSHLEEEYGGEDIDDLLTSHILIDSRHSKGTSLTGKADTKPAIASPHIFPTLSQYLVNGGEGEEGGRVEDPSYVTYRMASFNMLHKKYAEVNFELYEVPVNDIVISITAIDGICAYMYKVIPVIDGQHVDEYMEIPNFTTIIGDSATGNTQKHLQAHISTVHTKSSSFHTDGIELHTSVDLDQTIEQDIIVQTVVKVNWGNDFTVSTTEDACELTMDLERCDAAMGKVRDTLEIHFDYMKNITDLFQYFVDQISKFKNYQRPDSREFYFLEHQNEDCHVTGLRFVSDLPKPTEYSFSASNTFTELKKLQNINELMTNDYPWFVNDMKKFPRFTLKRERVPSISETFPLVLTANMYVKIPPQLCNTAEIHKFVEPIEDFTFKQTQRYLKDAIEYYLRPRIRTALAKLWSTNNWKLKLEDHKRRLFREQQRTVLYKAMLQHRVFPKYNQFRQDFYGHVKNIDFFQFVIQRCYKPEEQIEEERLVDQKQSPKDKRSKGDTYREKAPVDAIEPQKSTTDGLQLRYSRGKSHVRATPKCITTVTHTTANLDI
ncbi:uncharacterized protein LOC118740078 [Rhagoletis pomonella]|uniref:uncharacterized protein LOC118740078 n=1 Tax=Rhagoletis pomonella TaxID=28610 RepID=UPI00177B5FFA|nr:uncharacterized protein LOC118740078 [Rhagoletis pomonella]